MMCFNPYMLHGSSYVGKGGMLVPCGKCIQCKKRRAAAWSFRLLQEDRIARTSSFVTLTYDDDHLPRLSNDDSTCKCRYRGDYKDLILQDVEPLPTLCRCDVQKFLKRLRKKQFGNGRSDIRYYFCGEYGTNTKRPHYHAIMFNADTNCIADSWSLDGSSLGQIKFGDVGQASIHYVTSYITKHTDYDCAPRLREFSLMSKGIGKNYLTPDTVDWHLFNAANYTVFAGGQKNTLPRYYKDRIFDEDARRAFGELAEEAYLAEQMKLIDKLGYDKWLHESKNGMEAKLNSMIYRSQMRNKL